MPRRLLSRPWLPDDDALLIELHESGASATVMTRKLRRSMGSLRTRISKLNLTPLAQRPGGRLSKRASLQQRPDSAP